MMKRNQFRRFAIITLSLTLLVSSALSGCGHKEETTEDSNNKPESSMSKDSSENNSTSETTEAEPLIGDFATVTYTGEPVDQTIFEQADLTMINVWTTFCGYCLEEMPLFQTFSEEYKAQGLQIIGIVSNITEVNDQTVTDINKDLGITYPQLLASDDLLASFLRYVQSVPTTVFVDSEGKLVGKPHIGARNETEWKKIIEQSLELVHQQP